MKRRQVADRQAYLRAGIVAAAVYNSFGGTEKPVSPLDFVPGEKKKGEVPTMDLRDMTPEEQEEYVLKQFVGKRNVVDLRQKH